MINIKEINFDFAADVVFDDASLNIYRTDKIGLIGQNGCGKTTLLRILSNQLEVNSGVIEKEGKVEIGIIPQEIFFDENETPFSFVKKSFEEELNLIYRFENLIEDENFNNSEYDDLLAKIEEKDAYNVDYKVKIMLNSLGIDENDMNRFLKEMSGGYKVRTYLAYLLLKEPDLLLLDEPTNYLDIDARVFLINYLKNYSKAFCVVSHDVYFLNNVVKKIAYVANNTIFEYSNCDYTQFRNRLEIDIKTLEEFDKNNEKKIEHLQKFVDRFKAKATLTSRAKSKEKQIERLKKIKTIIPKENKLNFEIKSSSNTFSQILSFDNVGFSYSERKNIFQGCNLSLVRGEKYFIVGKNGLGKTTLLKLIANVVKNNSGDIVVHNNAKISYFAQNLIEQLDYNNTLIEEFAKDNECNELNETEQRKVLGVFGFTGNDIYKKVEVLSGGEKMRLLLSRIYVNKPDLLIMDEPTTHLDIDTKDLLARTLKRFKGALCVVSHDIDFMNKVSLKYITIKDKKLVQLNSLNEYFKLLKDDKLVSIKSENKKKKDEKVENLKQDILKHKNKNRISKNKMSKLKSELKILEKKIVDLEHEIDIVNSKVSSLDDSKEIHLLSQKLQKKNEELNNLDELYFEKADEIENSIVK